MLLDLGGLPGTRIHTTCGSACAFSTALKGKRPRYCELAANPNSVDRSHNA